MERNELYEQFSTGFLLTKCARWLLIEYQQQAHAIGLTPIQLGILFCLSHSNYNMQQLCELLVINKTVASRTLKLLKEKGVVFVKQGVQDARCTLYSLNKEKWQEIQPHLLEVEDVVAEKIAYILPKAKQQQLHSLLFALLTQRDNETTSMPQTKDITPN